MTRRRSASAVCAALVALTVVPAADAAPPGFHSIISDKTHDGGTWEVSARHTRLGGIRGICVDLDYTDPTGFQPGPGGGCLAGDLAAVHGVAPIATTSGGGGALTSSLVGGIVTARAWTVVVRFADHKKLRIHTRRGPRGWRHLLHARVRWFGADALAVTAADPKTATIYDRRGHRLARVKA